MNFKALFVSFCVFAFSVSTAQAVSKNEIVLGVSPLLGYGGKTTGGDFNTNLSNTFQVTVAAEYGHAVLPFLQVSLSTAFSLLDAGAGALTYLQVLAGPTINLPLGEEWLQNSFFIQPMGGFVLLDTSFGSSDVVGALAADVGYRLALASNFNWRPALGMFKVLNGSKVLFTVRPISFSLIF